MQHTCCWLCVDAWNYSRGGLDQICVAKCLFISEFWVSINWRVQSRPTLLVKRFCCEVVLCKLNWLHWLGLMVTSMFFSSVAKTLCVSPWIFYKLPLTFLILVPMYLHPVTVTPNKLLLLALHTSALVDTHYCALNVFNIKSVWFSLMIIRQGTSGPLPCLRLSVN